MKIHQLSPQIVAKIAAGEVIERPVYAGKELVENAIDAGADSIEVHIEESGLKKIVVIDNGEGMTREDLKESIKPHSTSKISRAQELISVKTLGFRGEALASIAAISHLTIESKIKKSTEGTKVVVVNGKIEKLSSIGMPHGTKVIVDYLFHSLPARKKFLKSPRTEFRQILDLTINFALSYPQIQFVLTHNKKTILDLPKSTETMYRIEKIFGKDMFASLLPVSFKDSYISISGYIAKPTFTARTPNKQFLFINNRLVHDKDISLTIKSAYGTLLANNVYPVCVLYFFLPFEMVDVNVHPRKEYVRFVDHAMLQESAKHSVLQTLTSYNLTPISEFTNLFLHDAVGSTDSYAGKLLKEKKLPWELSGPLLTDFSTILQVHNLYLFAPSADGFLLIDQHAAHERILYEQFLDEFMKEKKKPNVFHFPKPGIFELSLSDSEKLQEYLQVFQEMGWGIEHFKGTTFLLRSLPVLFQDRDYVKLLTELLEDMREGSSPKNVDEVSKQMIAYLACRGAVKAGDRLTRKQAKDLAAQLEKTANNTTCPHGRPTRVFIELEQINHLFKR